MSEGKIEVICGSGSGKTALAIGRGIEALGCGKAVIVIQFLKGKQSEPNELLKQLEPEFKLFRFERTERYFAELSDEEKQEELINIKNGLNFARKVMTTGECDLLILDEILGILDHGIISEDEFKSLLGMHQEMNVIITGKVFPESLKSAVDDVTLVTKG